MGGPQTLAYTDRLGRHTAGMASFTAAPKRTLQRTGVPRSLFPIGPKLLAFLLILDVSLEMFPLVPAVAKVILSGSGCSHAQ